MKINVIDEKERYKYFCSRKLRSVDFPLIIIIIISLGAKFQCAISPHLLRCRCLSVGQAAAAARTRHYKVESWNHEMCQ